MNTLGRIFRFTSFGESHGPAIGGVIDGMPAGVGLDIDAIQAELDRRRPGAAPGSTGRMETDQITILSGIFEKKTTGTPIAFTIANKDARPADYDAMRDMIRPGHADATYLLKYGIRDHRGGGRASARATAASVAAGAVARQFLALYGIDVRAQVVQVGEATDEAGMEAEIVRAINEGDTVGGAVACTVSNCPAGLGEPLFGKLQAMLAASMMSINAVKGFEYGDGFSSASMRGTQHFDLPTGIDTVLHTATNHAGGILGGISTGADITMRVAFKPIASMMRDISTIDTNGSPTILYMRGRHDVCAAFRGCPVVEAMACLTIADALLLARASKPVCDIS